MRYVIGFLGIGFGILMAIKHDWFMYNFGRIPSIEKFARFFGGSRMFYIVLGSLIAILSMLYMTGALSAILSGIATSIFGGGE